MPRALRLRPRRCRGSEEGSEEGGEGGTYRADKRGARAIGWATTYRTHLSGFRDCGHGAVGQWGSGAAGQQGSGAAGQRGSGAAGQRGSGAAGQRGSGARGDGGVQDATNNVRAAMG